MSLIPPTTVVVVVVVAEVVVVAVVVVLVAETDTVLVAIQLKIMRQSDMRTFLLLFILHCLRRR